MEALNPGLTVYSLNQSSGGALTLGGSFAIPGYTVALTYQVFYSSPPTSQTTKIQTSNDNNIWSDAVLVTDVNGRIATLFTSAKFIRSYISAKNGFGTTTVSFVVQKLSSIAGSEIFDFALTGLIPDGTVGQQLVTDGAGTLSFTSEVGTIPFFIDGAGAVITTGYKGSIQLPFAGILTGWTILSIDDATLAGAIVIDIWKDTYANFPPTNADSITNAHEPAIAASATKATDADITDWTTTAFSSGDILAFNVDSVADFTKVVISLNYRKV